MGVERPKVDLRERVVQWIKLVDKQDGIYSSTRDGKMDTGIVQQARIPLVRFWAHCSSMTLLPGGPRA